MRRVLNAKKKRKRRNNKGFLGISLPKKTFDFITLYCNAFGVAKSSVVCALIEEWVIEQLRDMDVSELESKIASKAFASFMKSDIKNFEKFKHYLEIELKQKKLDDGTIGRILNLLNDEKEKDRQD